MKKAVILFIIIAWPLMASDKYLYDAYQRDLILLFDWRNETLEALFNTNKLFQGLSVVINNAQEALYYQSAPVIVSMPLWETLRATDDLVMRLIKSNGKSIEEHSAQVSDYYKQFPKYKNTLLVDKEFIKEFIPLMQLAIANYNQLNKELEQKLQNKSIITDFDKILDSINQDPKFTNDNDIKDGKHWVLTQRLLGCFLVMERVKESNFLFYKLDENFMLCIAQSYRLKIQEKINELFFNTNTTLEQVVQKLEVRDISNKNRPAQLEEIVMQLKLHNFKLLEDPYRPSHDIHNNDFIAIDYLLKNLIITQKEQEAMLIEQAFWQPAFCQWYIYGMGHGERDWIMGLSLHDFNRFIESLQQYSIKLFYYNSCYAAGANLDNAYKDIFNQQYTLDFTVIAGGITDSPTWGFIFPPKIPPYGNRFKLEEGDIDFITKKLILKFKGNFKKFFNALHMGNYLYHDGTMVYIPAPSLDQTLNYVATFYDPKTQKIIDIANVPQIRFPGTQWFNVIALPKLALYITPLLAHVKEAEKQSLFSAVKYHKGKRRAIHERELVIIDAFPRWKTKGPALKFEPFSAHINVPLVIDKVMPTIVCTATKDAVLYIKEIKARNIGITDFVRKFLGVAETRLGRLYYCPQVILSTNEFSTEEQALLNIKNYKHIELKEVLIFVNYRFAHASKTQLIFFWNNMGYAIEFSPSDIDTFLKEPTKRPSITPTKSSIRYPYFTKEKDIKLLNTAEKDLLLKDREFKKELKYLRKWIKDLNQADKEYLAHYNYFINKKPKILEADIYIKPNDRAQTQVKSLIKEFLTKKTPFERDIWQKSLNKESQAIINSFAPLYKKFREFKKWRKNLSTKNLRFITSYYDVKEQIDLTAVSGLVKRNKELIVQYTMLKDTPDLLQAWISELALRKPLEYQYIVRYEKNMSDFFHTRLLQLDYDLTMLGRILL